MNLSPVPSKVFSIPRPPSARLELISADPRLEARVVAPGAMTLLGYVPDEGAFDACLAMKVDGNFVTLAVHKGMNKEEIFEAFAAALPEGYEAVTADSQSEVIVLSVLKMAVRTPEVPQVKFLTNDPSLSLRYLGKNRFALSGRATPHQTVRSFVELSIDGRTQRIHLESSEPALAVAGKLRAALPAHFQAMVALPLYGEDRVQVTILRRLAH